MRTSTIFEIKDELGTLNQSELIKLCLQLARNKKENKEFITFSLFESGDLRSFSEEVKSEIRTLMADVHQTNMHAAKKTIRKILRLTNKYIKFGASKTMEVELRIVFCEEVQKSGIPINRSPVLQNMLAMQVRKIRQAISSLHEDLQYDYSKQVDSIHI